MSCYGCAEERAQHLADVARLEAELALLRAPRDDPHEPDRRRALYYSAKGARVFAGHLMAHNHADVAVERHQACGGPFWTVQWTQRREPCESSL